MKMKLKSIMVLNQKLPYICVHGLKTLIPNIILQWCPVFIVLLFNFIHSIRCKLQIVMNNLKTILQFLKNEKIIQKLNLWLLLCMVLWYSNIWFLSDRLPDVFVFVFVFIFEFFYALSFVLSVKSRIMKTSAANK